VVKDRALLRTWFIILVLLGPLLTAAFMVGRMTAPTVAEVSPENAAGQGSAASPGTKALVDVANPKQSALHGTYLQLAAVPDQQVLVERLHQSGFHAVALEVPGRPGLYRVLVGPLHEDSVAQTRVQLENKGLPGNSAIPRNF
jgi:hypothetical protein